MISIARWILTLRCILSKQIKEFFVRNLRLGLPLSMNGRDGSLSCLSARGGDSYKIAVQHDRRTHLLGCLRISRHQCRVERRLPEHFAVEHVLQLLVRRITMLSGDEVSPVDFQRRLSRHLPLRRRSQRLIRRDTLRNLLPLQQNRIFDGAITLRINDPAVRSDQLLLVSLPLRRRQANQYLARCSRSLAKLRIHRRSRPAAECSHVKWRELRIPHHHFNSVDRNVKLFCYSLAQGSPYVLAHLHLSGVNRHLAVLADMQPGINLLWKRFSAPLSAAPRLLCDNRGLQDRHDHNTRPQKFEEVAAVEIEPVWSGGSEFVTFRLQRNPGIRFRSHRLTPSATAGACAFDAL